MNRAAIKIEAVKLEHIEPVVARWCVFCGHMDEMSERTTAFLCERCKATVRV